MLELVNLSLESDVPLLDAASEDTIELELSAEQIVSLSPAADTSLRTEPKYRRSAWPAVVVSIAAASVLSGGIVYLATTPAEPLRISANNVVRSVAAETTVSSAADLARVQFTNPFDATEVFEFPSGTSETEARHAVADILLQRAHERQNVSKITRHRRKAADQVASVRTVQSRQTQLTSADRPQGLREEKPSL